MLMAIVFIIMVMGRRIVVMTEMEMKMMTRTRWDGKVPS
jgi:hypothetical protein